MSKRIQPQVVTIGEVLADFVPEGNSHILRPGGAPANVAVNLSRRGIRAGLISKTGKDFIGDFLVSFLKDNNVDTSCVTNADKYKTGLVFVFLKKDGERDFTFYGHPSADTQLSEKDIRKSYIQNAEILHFGSIGMMAPKSRAATIKAIMTAREKNILVSYDPNVRLNLWKGKYDKGRIVINRYFKYADIVKISDVEFKFLFGKRPVFSDIDKVFRKNQLIFISLGKNGSVAKMGNMFVKSPGNKVKAIDTTGAGDAFMAGVLEGMIKAGKGLDLTEKDLVNISKLANKMGARAVTHKGAV